MNVFFTEFGDKLSKKRELQPFLSHKKSFTVLLQLAAAGATLTGGPRLSRLRPSLAECRRKFVRIAPLQLPPAHALITPPMPLPSCPPPARPPHILDYTAYASALLPCPCPPAHTFCAFRRLLVSTYALSTSPPAPGGVLVGPSPTVPYFWSATASLHRHFS